MQDRLDPFQSRCEPVLDPSLRKWKKVVWLVFHKPRLHQHRLDVTECVTVELLSETRAALPLHWKLAEKRKRLLELLPARLQQ